MIALATTGASAVVGAMATDAWQTARTGVLRLFRREGDAPPDDTESRLDADRDRLEGAAEDDGLREALTALWREQLLDLLRDRPERADELRSLTRDLSLESVPDERAAQVQHVTAHSNGVAIGVQGGDAHYHAAPTPPPRDEGGRAARQ